VIQTLANGAHFDATYFRSEMLSEIDQNRPLLTAEDQRRRMVLYFDNATSRTTRETAVYFDCHQMRRAPHSSFSLDLSPSDICLFGKVQTALMGAAFSDENELFHGVTDVLSGISPDELEAVFANWVATLNTCIQRRGEYIGE
jgi:hypothetical protein